MSEERRGLLTIGLGFLTAIVLGTLFIAAAAQGELTSARVALASAMLVLATVGTISIWRIKGSVTQKEKLKRRSLDSLLHDLSDDELAELKDRLTGVSHEENIGEYLDDDAEIRQRR